MDEDSGRVSYLVNRRTWLRVTQLVLGLLRVADARIATLRGNILQGRAPGRTELQVTTIYALIFFLFFHYFLH